MVMENEKYLIWHVQGGLGKNIAATALCKYIKLRYPDRQLILVCTYPEIFLNMPMIDRVYGLDKLSYFYETYIENKDVIIFKHDPYDQTGHITGKNHIIESWCEILDIEYTKPPPLLDLNYAQQLTKYKFTNPKPILILQTTGGIDNIDGKETPPYSWSRDIPLELSLEIVKKYSSNYHIIHITKKNGYYLPNVERIDYKIPSMELFALLSISTKRILIDSALQHASAAFKMHSTVFWIGTSPKVFGYDIHTNIEADITSISNQLMNSYEYPHLNYFNEESCPYKDANSIFNIQEVLNELGN